jgi:hypothetical protein
VNEANWQACTNPCTLLRRLGDGISRRKYVLALVEWAVPFTEGYQPGYKGELAECEQAAEGLAEETTSIHGLYLLERPVVDALAGTWAHARLRPGYLCACGWGPDRLRFCNMLREVFPSPFRPVAWEPFWAEANGAAARRVGEDVYADKAWHDLPLVADALEDAGCTSDDLLDHLRRPGGHARGCWALDCVLGKG